MLDGVKELLELLRAFVHEVPLTDAEMQGLDKALPEVLSFSKLHNVLGIWAYKVREYYQQNGITNEEEQEVFDTAEELYSRVVARSTKRENSYRQLSKQLKEAGIDHLSFKGIVVKDCYPVPELRTFGDIDLVIRKEDRENCHALMQKENYDVITGFEPVYTYQKEKELYEVHTSIMAVNMTDRADYIGYFQNLWQYAKETDKHVWVFTPEFHFVYLLSHIAKHIYGSGAGIRMYLDLAFYIKCLGDSMDWDIVQEEIKKLELSRFFSLSMDAIRRWFDVALPVVVPETEEELFRAFSVFTMESGVFGYEGRTRGEQVIRKSEHARHRALRKTLFPSVDVIKSRYTYLQRRPYLLPIAWVDRLLRNLGIVGRKLEESKEILMTKDEVIQARKEFYHKIGL